MQKTALIKKKLTGIKSTRGIFENWTWMKQRTELDYKLKLFTELLITCFYVTLGLQSFCTLSDFFNGHFYPFLMRNNDILTTTIR